MKTLISIVFTFAMFAQSLWADLPSCSSYRRIAGGVIAVVMVSTNAANGTSTVLPVRVKMLPEVESNPYWSRPLFFGTNVTVLPPQTVNVSPGYLQNYVTNHDVSYSCDFPIFIQSDNGDSTWTNEFYFTLQGISSEMGVAGPCQTSSESAFGSVRAGLYAGSNTNGLDVWPGGYEPNRTNSLLRRYGLGACDAKVDDYASRSTVSFVFFNLPPKNPTAICGPPYTDPYPCYCQPATNFFEHMWFADANTNDFMPYCGYDVSYPPGFLIDIACNYNNPQNWPYITAPCPPSGPPKTYRLLYEGSIHCNEDTNNVEAIRLMIAPYREVYSNVITSGIILSFQVNTNYWYKIEYKDNDGWTNLFSWMKITTGGLFQIHIEFTPIIPPRRFYRLGYRTTN